MTSLLSKQGLLADQPAINPARPHAARPPHYPAKPRTCWSSFAPVACSQLETWDYKPELIKHDGKPLKNGPPVTFQGPAGNLARPQYEFRPYGQNRQMCSDMVPHLASMADDYAFIHSLTSKSNTHGPAHLHRLHPRWFSQHGRASPTPRIRKRKPARLCRHSRSAWHPTIQRQ